MKVFYNKNKLLYNLELFLVYILSYMVDYTRKHLNVLWLTETLAERTKHDDWLTSPKSVCCKVLSYNFSNFFFLSSI